MRLCRLILSCAFSDGHRLAAASRFHLQSQAFWNQNAIEQIKDPLDNQGQESGWNRALQDGHVII